MADPFSIATGVIGLAETGTSLASFLTDKYKAYRDAPEQILEIAHEVEFCAGLIDIFASGIKRAEREKAESGGQGESDLPRKFRRDAGNLIAQTRHVFNEIYDLIPKDRELDDSVWARWHYVRDKKKLADKLTRLRQLQQMFMFMETMFRYSSSSSSSSNPSTGAGISASGQSQLQAGDFEGSLQQIPVQINATANGGGLPVSFQATLTLKPMVQAATFSSTVPIQPETRSASTNEEKVERKERLENLRRSPYFSLDLLDPPISSRAHAVTYSETINLDEEDEDVSKPAHDQSSEDDRQGPEGRRPEILSKNQASEQIDSMYERWFTADAESDAEQAPSSEPPEQHSESDYMIIQPYPSDNGSEAGDAKPSVVVYNVPERNATDTAGSVKRHPPPPTARRDGTGTRPNGASHSGAPTTRSDDSHAALTHGPQLTYECNGCNKQQTNGFRFRCQNCPDFDFCSPCFGDPEKTARHVHPKRCFIELQAALA